MTKNRKPSLKAAPTTLATSSADREFLDSRYLFPDPNSRLFFTFTFQSSDCIHIGMCHHVILN